MRLFLAFDPDKPVRAAMTALQQSMHAMHLEGDYVPAGNFHVTLRFLGETDDLGGVSHALTQCVRGIRPFSLTLDHLSAFGAGPKKTAVVKLCGTAELKALFESTEAALAAEGFVRERRPLVPHITLARRVAFTAEQASALSATLPHLSFVVDHVTLYESVRGRYGQMMYQPLQRERL